MSRGDRLFCQLYMLPVQRALRWRPLSFKWPMGLSSPPGAKGVQSFAFDRYCAGISDAGNDDLTTRASAPVKIPIVPPAPPHPISRRDFVPWPDSEALTVGWRVRLLR